MSKQRAIASYLYQSGEINKYKIERIVENATCSDNNTRRKKSNN